MAPPDLAIVGPDVFALNDDGLTAKPDRMGAVTSELAATGATGAAGSAGMAEGAGVGAGGDGGLSLIHISEPTRPY